VHRILGAFALGTGPEQGMAVDGRVLVPPRSGAPTLALDRHGRVLVGPWSLEEELPPALTSFVQGTAPFQRDGAPPPPRWDDDLITERAALCVTGSGFLLHAWGPAVDAPALSRALALAGCEIGLHIGRRPAPLGFVHLDRGEDGAWRAERLSPSMSIAPERLVAASPGAFAALVLRDPTPPARPRRASWASDGGTQPPPAWLPAVHAAEVVNLGARVRLVAFAPDRFAFRLRAGRREIAPRGAPDLPEALSPDEHARALAAIGLGTGRRRGPRGLAIGGVIGLRFRGEGGLLLVDGGRVRILPAGAADRGGSAAALALPPGVDATELPLTAERAKLLPAAREISAMRRRSAACVLDDDTFVVASTTFDSDEATTEALLDLGCARVVALDRGARRRAFVHRAGAPPLPDQEDAPGGEKDTEDPKDGDDQGEEDKEDPPPAAPPPSPAAAAALEASYDATTLFLIEVPMLGRAARLDSPGPAGSGRPGEHPPEPP
jgi:hypothetical protein